MRSPRPLARFKEAEEGKKESQAKRDEGKGGEKAHSQ